MSTLAFREELAKLPRETLLQMVKEQDVDLWKNVNRIEAVFANKMRHLTWPDGSQITERQITNEELALLVDEPFKSDPELTKAGLSLDEQREVWLAKDPVLWAKYFLNERPRAYQVMMLRHPNNRRVLRAGRRLGKTWTMAVALLHYSWTHKDGRCLVIAPMKSHVELIYTEVMRLAKSSDLVISTITRNVTSPQFVIEFSNGATIRFFTTGMKSGGKCLTPDHDVLSRDGWKPISDVVEGEEILAWHEEGERGRYKWQPILQTHEYDFNGELVAHEGKQISFRVTPNHKFAAKTRAPGAPWRDVYAEDLKDYYIPTSGKTPDLGDGTYFSNEQLELWGWWLAEGSGFIGKMARISQTKEVGRKRIIELAEAIGLHYTTPKKEIRVKWEPPIYSGTNAYNKFIPRELMGHDNGWALLGGLLGGDGWMRKNGGWEYSSSSFQLANDVQELAIRLGYRANLREKVIRYLPVDGSVANRHWVVAAYPYSKAIINPDRLKREHYEGKVHCVTVDSGYFLTRHNGLVHVTGNSDVARGQEAHIIVLDELDYMGPEDLDAIYAMLQQTAEGQGDKLLIGASTPTGKRETFYKWCHSPRFKEFWFPSYVNPFFNKAMEDELREQHTTEMAYRHEVEADWGEDVQGVYPRKYVDLAFRGDWSFEAGVSSTNSFFVMGVDWDKYGAGTNIVVLEVCDKDTYEIPEFRGKIRLAYREETKKEEYTLIKAVQRIINLNSIFSPRHIYVDRGYGETQVELLHKYGVENPHTQLRKRVVGVSFSETLDIRDPHSKELQKKEIKPFMVDNLRQFMEKEMIIFPRDDEELHMQLISYVVARFTQLGRPVFEMSSSSVGDHAHDALILACLSITQNYGDLMKVLLARNSKAISNEAFLPTFEVVDEHETEIAEKTWGSTTEAPINQRRTMVVNMGNGLSKIRRRSF